MLFLNGRSPDVAYVRRLVADSLKAIEIAPELIRGIRTELGLSQREMARRLGITNVWLCELESGRRQCTWEMLCKIAALE